MEACRSAGAVKFVTATVDGCGVRGKASMPTRLYRFHCTDGRNLVVDLRGKRLPTLALMRSHAERVALDMMQGCDRIDWSAWQVDVYDATGRPVLSKAFTDVRGWTLVSASAVSP